MAGWLERVGIHNVNADRTPYRYCASKRKFVVFQQNHTEIVTFKQIQLASLVNRADLNGAVATLRSWDQEAGRWNVLCGEESFNVRPENVTFSPAVSQSVTSEFPVKTNISTSQRPPESKDVGGVGTGLCQSPQIAVQGASQDLHEDSLVLRPCRQASGAQTAQPKPREDSTAEDARRCEAVTVADSKSAPHDLQEDRQTSSGPHCDLVLCQGSGIHGDVSLTEEGAVCATCGLLSLEYYKFLYSPKCECSHGAGFSCLEASLARLQWQLWSSRRDQAPPQAEVREVILAFREQVSRRFDSKTTALPLKVLRSHYLHHGIWKPKASVGHKKAIAKRVRCRRKPSRPTTSAQVQDFGSTPPGFWNLSFPSSPDADGQRTLEWEKGVVDHQGGPCTTDVLG